MKNFNETWTSPGATVVEKDSLKKHINSELHQLTVELGNKRNPGLLLTLKKSLRKCQLDMAYRKCAQMTEKP